MGKQGGGRKEGLVHLVLSSIWYKLSEITGNRVRVDNRLKDVSSYGGVHGGGWGGSPGVSELGISYNRLDRYRDYEMMDANSPYIATALDIYASDCCQYDPFMGATVWVNSSDKLISKKLNEFLQQVMDVEEVAESECRMVAKYGSMKNLFLIKEGKGIVRVMPIVDDINVLRIEDRRGALLGFRRVEAGVLQQGFSGVIGDEEDRRVDYLPFEVGHPRIRAYPYVKTVDTSLSAMYDIPLEGMSMIESSRKVVKDYEMLKEAIMVYRLTHSIDRLEHKIDLSGKAADEGLDYMNKYMNSLKRRQFVDKQTGRLSLLANLPSFMEDLFTPVWKDSLTSTQLLKVTGDVSSIEDLKVLQEEIEGSLKFPPGFLFRNDGATLQSNASVSSQNIILAKYIEKLQRAYKRYIFKACQVHLALQNLDFRPGLFVVNMSPVSHALDLTKLEVLSSIVNNAAQLLPLGEALGIDKNLWNKYVFRLTFSRIDFGEVVAAIGNLQAQQGTGLFMKVREKVMDNDESLRSLSPEVREFLEGFREVMGEREFEEFSRQLDRFVETVVQFPQGRVAGVYNRVVNREVYDFTRYLRTKFLEDVRLYSDYVERRKEDGGGEFV